MSGRRSGGMQESRDRQSPSATSVGGTTTVPCEFPLSESGLLITEVRVSPRNEEKLKAFVSITLDNCFVIRGIKVIEGRQRLFVAMPSRQKTDGTFQDIVHPINQETRDKMEAHILRVYYEVVEGKLVT
jgi:stage V sporulation protein G